MDNVLDQGRLAQLMQQIQSANTSGSWMKQAVSLIVEQMLSAEVDERLGRMPSQRVGDQHTGEALPFTGYRNGYKSRRLKTAEGRVDVEVPQVRDYPDGPYRSEIWKAISKKSPALQRMACEMYARGLSTRDIEELLGDLCASQGDLDQTLLSKSAVSQVTEALREEYESFTKRDLAGFDVVYLFCDAVYESIRQQTGVGTSQAILVTWAICSDGSKQLLHMSLGNKEGAESWLEHFRSLVSRNLPTPITVTSDGAPGLIKAIEAMWPEAERLRCWFHKMKNVLDKVPDEMREEIKRLLQDVRDAPDHATGAKRAEQFVETYEKTLPSAMACLKDDLDATLAHLKLPSLHQKMVRTTNLCERSFVEERRRTKIIPRFFDERGCLKLVFASLWRASQRWRGVRFTPMEKQQLEAYIRVRRAMGKNVRSVAA
jgi:transposase-like protein